MKPQSKPQVVTIFDGQVQTTPYTLEQCRRINPAFWAALARIQARIERKAREEEAPALVG